MATDPQGDVPLCKPREKLFPKSSLGETLLDILAVIAVATFVLPAAFVAVLLYWIIRLGVKHGLRSYEAEKARDAENAP
jgi:hypothetical protein